MAYSPLRDPKTGRFVKNPNKPSASQSKDNSNVMLGVLAADVASLKVSVLKLTKLFEDEKKSAAIDRQRQRTEDYASKYKKAGPTRAEKAVVKEDKKSFLDMIKDALSGIFKFALIGLASIGIFKLLSMPGVMNTITDFTKKLIIGISDGLQKGMSFISNLLNDQGVINSIFNLAKSVFKFIGDAITAGANFFSNFVSDPENQQTLSGIIVAIITGIANAIKAAYTVSKDLLSDNSEAIKEGAMSVFLVIKDIIVGTLKAGQNMLKSADLKEQFVSIANSILNFVGEVMNMPIFEWEGGKITLKQALIGLAAATLILFGGMQVLIGALQGMGMRAAGIGGGRGGGSGKSDGKTGRRKGRMGFLGLSGLSTADKVMTGVAVAGIGYTAYDAMTPDRTDRPTGPSGSPSPAPTSGPSGTPSTPSQSMASKSYTMPKVTQQVGTNLGLVEGALKNLGINDPNYITAIQANIMKESGGKSISENMNYGNTPNDRIRSIFGSRAAKYSDEQLSVVKKDPVQMGELMYGAGTALGQKMGNTEPGDGYKYRGRGFIQLTGKNNYAAASMDLFKDNRLVANPDLVNDPNIAALTVAWYMKKGMARMAKSLNINTASMSQEQANLLATSQIAGSDIRKKGAIGQEIMAKVDAFSGSLGGTQTAAFTPVVPSMQTAAASQDAEGHDHAPGGNGGGEPEKQPKSIMDSFMDSLSAGLTDFDKSTGGKLGFASSELQTILRDKSFLEAFQSPLFTDMSKNSEIAEVLGTDEKTPSVYDDMLLSKLSRA